MVPDRANPRVIAQGRRHADRANRPACPADDTKTGQPCTCVPLEDDLAAVWQGAARMARARKTAGQRLSAYDRQALDRCP